MRIGHRDNDGQLASLQGAQHPNWSRPAGQVKPLSIGSMLRLGLLANLFLLALAALTASCAGLPDFGRQAVTPTFIEERGQAVVDELEVLIIGERPREVRVVARGMLPDSCTFLDNLATERQEKRFVVLLTTRRVGGSSCLEQVIPFEKVIPLDIFGLQAGLYEVRVNDARASFELEIDNLLPPTPEPDSRTARIAGVVWHDLCGVAGATAREPQIVTDGCVPAKTGGYIADGRLEPGEPGIGGVEVLLADGTCPAFGTLKAQTDSQGTFVFSGLGAGTYCIYVDALTGTNQRLLLPGRWSAPAEDSGYLTVSLTIGESHPGADLGWDFERLPAVNQPGCVTEAGFIEDISYPDKSVLPPGQVFTKTWRIRNSGSCHWGADHKLDFLAGDIMGGEAVSLPTVLAGEFADVSVVLTAPIAEGSYRGDWVLKTPEGELFGTPDGFDLTLFVDIIVDEAARPVGRIEGLIWSDRCETDIFGDPEQGCEPRGLEDFIANGEFDPGESGIPGVTVFLYENGCGLGRRLALTVLTDASGRYEFESLAPGTYCVVVDPLLEENNLLLPGLWTSPGVEVGELETRLRPNFLEAKADFGWDFFEPN